MRFFICFIAMILLFMVNSASARGMWGSRRKRDDDEEVVAVEANGGFESSRRHATRTYSRSGESLPVMGKTDKVSIPARNEASEKIEGMMNTYFKMMEELLDSPNFESMVTPDAVRGVFEKIPALAANPEVQTLLNSPQLTDPQLLRSTVREGMTMIKSYFSEISSLLSNPEQLSALVAQLPEEVQSVVQAIASGDMSALNGLVEAIPGLSSEQKAMYSQLLEGRTDGLLKNVQEQLGDVKQVEAMRQQFLANPSLAETLGISEDLLRDKVKFAAFFEEGMAELLGAMGDAGAGGEQDMTALSMKQRASAAA